MLHQEAGTTLQQQLLQQATSALCFQVAKSWIWPSPAREADMHHMMRRLSGSSHTVQMELASSAYQDGQKHSYLVLE